MIKVKKCNMMLCMSLILLLMVLAVNNCYILSATTNSEAVKLNISGVILLKGSKVTLKVLTPMETVTWTSRKKSIATVNKNGVVKAKKKGTTYIIAKVKYAKHTYKAKCKVIVEAPKLSKKSMAMTVGNIQKIEVTGTQGPVIWSSSNTAVATVEDGTVKALAKGDVAITARINNLVLTCKVNITNPQDIYNSNFDNIISHINANGKISDDGEFVVYQKDDLCISTNIKGSYICLSYINDSSYKYSRASVYLKRGKKNSDFYVETQYQATQNTKSNMMLPCMGCATANIRKISGDGSDTVKWTDNTGENNSKAYNIAICNLLKKFNGSEIINGIKLKDLGFTSYKY